MGVRGQLVGTSVYDFIGLQGQSFTVSRAPATRFAGDTVSVNDRTMQMITAGLNYKFSLW